MKKFFMISFLLNIVLIFILTSNIFNIRDLKHANTNIIKQCHIETSKELDKLRVAILNNDNDSYRSILDDLPNTIYPLSEIGETNKFSVVGDFVKLLPINLVDINDINKQYILEFISTYMVIKDTIQDYNYDELFKNDTELNEKYNGLLDIVDTLNK